MVMSCETVQKSISAFIDQSLGEEERESVRVHLENCQVCHLRAEQTSRLRSELRRLAQISLAALWNYWKDRARLTVDNLMRPVALPVAGGLLSALFLFAVLVPTLGFQHNVRNDVPIGLYTQPSVDQISPFGITTEETVVELTIDEKGQIADYSIPAGQDSRQLEADIANMVLFSTFTPATWFGQPTSSKILVSFLRSHIVVRG